MRRICLDTETTGRDPAGGDRIVEIGCVELSGRRLDLDDPKLTFHTLLNPERDVPDEVVEIHGLSNEVLAKEPVFEEVADKLLDFVRGAELIIHNAGFDVAFLDMELRKTGRPVLEDVCARITDTLVMARKQFAGGRHTLDALCTKFKIDRSRRTRHGALLDAELLAEVYLKLTQGQDSFDVEVAGRERAGGSLPPLPDPSKLIVLRATEEESRRHEEMLGKVAKACKGDPLWTQSGG